MFKKLEMLQIAHAFNENEDIIEPRFIIFIQLNSIKFIVSTTHEHIGL